MLNVPCKSPEGVNKLFFVVQWAIPASQFYQDEPISVFLTVRRNGPLNNEEEFINTFGTLAGHIEHIAEHRVIPDVVVPLHQAIGI